MNVLYSKKFLKNLESLPHLEQGKIEYLVFVEIPKAKSFRQIPHIQKLAGYKSYYKIRVGNYRIGIEFKNDSLAFERVMHRKEIYRFFP